MPEKEHLPVYGKGGAGRKGGASAKPEPSSDPNVELARHIMELERKKNPSNKERKDLKQVRFAERTDCVVVAVRSRLATFVRHDRCASAPSRWA